MQEVDKRFEELLEDINKRFELIDKRFEQIVSFRQRCGQGGPAEIICRRRRGPCWSWMGSLRNTRRLRWAQRTPMCPFWSVRTVDREAPWGWPGEHGALGVAVSLLERAGNIADTHGCRKDTENSW